MSEIDPEVFLSYAWGKDPEHEHQKHVSHFKNHMHNYYKLSAWMDTSQMGPGQKLSDEIEKGIRNCKVGLDNFFVVTSRTVGYLFSNRQSTDWDYIISNYSTVLQGFRPLPYRRLRQQREL